MGIVQREFEEFYQKTRGSSGLPPQAKREVKAVFLAGVWMTMKSILTQASQLSMDKACVFLESVEQETEDLMLQYMKECQEETENA